MKSIIQSGRTRFVFNGWTVVLLTLLAGIGAGLLVGQWARQARSPVSLLEIPLHAESAVYAEDGFTLGSTRLEEDLDSFFFFDGLTGELKVLAFSPRTNKFMAEFSRQVVEDFELDKQIKNPRFMVVTGLVDMIDTDGSFRWGDSVFYVLEQNSGKVACYGVQLPPNLRSSEKKVYGGKLVGLDKTKVRKVRIRGKE